MQQTPPLGFFNKVWTGLNGFQTGVVAPFPTVSDADDAFQSTSSSGMLDIDVPAVWFVDPMMGIRFQIAPGVRYLTTGLSTAAVVDFANPGNGNGPANIGNPSVSATTTNSIQWTTTGTVGSPVVTNSFTTNAGWSRAYHLADSNAAPGGVPINYSTPKWLEETFLVTYAPATAGVIPDAAVSLLTGPYLVNGVPDGGLEVTVGLQGNALATAAVQVGNIPIALITDPLTGSYSTLWTNPAGTLKVTVTGNGASVLVVGSFRHDSLPSTTLTGAVPSSKPWYGMGGSTININGASNINIPSGQMGMTTFYEAKFTEIP